MPCVCLTTQQYEDLVALAQRGHADLAAYLDNLSPQDADDSLAALNARAGRVLRQVEHEAAAGFVVAFNNDGCEWLVYYEDVRAVLAGLRVELALQSPVDSPDFLAEATEVFHTSSWRGLAVYPIDGDGTTRDPVDLVSLAAHAQGAMARAA